MPTSARRLIPAALTLLASLLPCIGAGATPQQRPGTPSGDTILAPGLERALSWRGVGPLRGGRSIAVAGHPGRPDEYYFGATGGGLWKSTDGGSTWRPVTDGQLGSSSVGAVAVAPSDPDVVYLGMGETQLRGNVMQGDGVYRSDDGGRTWRHLGLAETQAIGRIRVHPRDPQVAWVAALGHPYGPNPERGVYRTEDGGETWSRVLFRNDRTGAVDLALDPSDPDVLYATLWEVYRRPWKLWSGGPGSGLFKSTDGGRTWSELTRNPGLPEGVLGKIAVTVSGADPARVWANVEAGDGGLYRSDDGGATWTLVNDHRDLWQRAFYFLRIQADPVDPEAVWVLNFYLHRSADGGETFQRIATPHVDHHDLWIDPDDPERMIVASDGGGSVSVNGGATWTEQDYPTAQIYRVTTTSDFPYHVCGSQQDNSTVCVASEPHHLRDPGSAPGAWMYAVGGGENAHIASRPDDPDVFYAGATNTLTRYDRRSGRARDVQPDPYMVMGEAAQAMPERWNWVYPIVLSPLDPGVLYAGSQHVWRTRNDGRSWQRISPDLTRAEPRTLGPTGGPVVKDQDGPEVYATLYSIAPSPHDPGVIWTGSDDGLVHLTRDGGATWSDVTPPGLPPHSRVGSVEVSPHRPGKAYVAARRYEMDDRAPYLFRTDDYGATWVAIADGIPPGHFLHQVREDPEREGLLYAGTEHGVRVSPDDGASWASLSLSLPDVQVSSLEVKGSDLVIATHGRGFWILDDLAPLRQWTPAVASGRPRILAPRPAVRREMPAVLDLWLPEDAGSVRVEILDGEGAPVRTLADAERLPEGLHRLEWDLRYPGATVFEGIVLEGPDPSRGPWAPPGRYRARLTVDREVWEEPFEVRMDPRLRGVSPADLRAQFELALRIRDATSAANGAVIRIRELRGRVRERLDEVRRDRGDGLPGSLADAAEALLGELDAVERALYQVRNRSPKDKIAFPIRLGNRLSGLRGNLERGDGAPTEGHRRVFDRLRSELDGHLARLEASLDHELGRVNALLEEGGAEAVRR